MGAIDPGGDDDNFIYELETFINAEPTTATFPDHNDDVAAAAAGNTECIPTNAPASVYATTKQMESMPMPKPKIVYQCHNCNTCYISRVDFEQHYRQTYQRNPMYTCQICKKQMTNMVSSWRDQFRFSFLISLLLINCSDHFVATTIGTSQPPNSSAPSVRENLSACRCSHNTPN